jgi:glycosyltransferase involved in cell wall biosynthesis
MTTPSPRKILFLTHGLRTGGAEALMVALLNGFHPDRIVPHLVILGPPGESEQRIVPQISVSRFVRTRKFDFSPSAGIAAILQEETIDTAFVHGLFSYMFLRRAVRRLSRPVRCVISLHTTKPRSVKDYGLGLLYGRMLRGDEVLCTVCERQAEYLSRTYFIPRRQFRTIYNGVDTDVLRPASADWDRASFRSMWDIPAHAYVIVLVALFRKEKRHEDALSALAEMMITGDPDTYLLFVGNGTQEREEELRAMAARLNLGTRVRFCGRQNEVAPFYWMSDLFTLSSVAVETFSMAALEAMSTGLPCVITDLGGAREMVEEGFNGFVVPPGQPKRLAGAWRAAHERRHAWNHAQIRERVIERFSIPRCVEAYEKVLTA